MLFIVVYGACNWITSRRTDLLALHFDWELRIPFVPAMVWVYLSLYATFALPPFALRKPALDVLGKRLALATLAGGAVFLLLPAKLGFERPAAVPGYDGAFGFIYFLDLPHNLLPSLHVAWSGLVLHAVWRPSARWARRFFEAWFALMAVSVVLVHQHHVLDVVAGLLLAYACATAVRDVEAEPMEKGSST